MSHAALFAVTLLITLLALSFWLTQRQEARQQSARLQQHRQVAQRCLDLLQALQLHRGLGAMQGAGNLEQRTRVARQLDSLWLNWPGASLQLPALRRTGRSYGASPATSTRIAA